MASGAAAVDVAVLGLGAMGGRIAERLLDAGHRVVVWNRTAAKAGPLVGRGAEAAATPAAAVADVHVAITMLADPAALAAVTEGEHGLAAALRPGQTLVEMSTVGPAAVARLREALREGVRLVDAPVLGSVNEASSGALVVFVGGADEDAERLEPLFRALGTPLQVGPLGSGAAAKLVANSTLFGVLAALGEAVALGDRLGVERDATFEVLARTPLAAQAERRRRGRRRSRRPLSPGSSRPSAPGSASATTRRCWRRSSRSRGSPTSPPRPSRARRVPPRSPTPSAPTAATAGSGSTTSRRRRSRSSPGATPGRPRTRAFRPAAASPAARSRPAAPSSSTTSPPIPTTSRPSATLVRR